MSNSTRRASGSGSIDIEAPDMGAETSENILSQMATAEGMSRPGSPAFGDGVSPVEQARQRNNWGSLYSPKIDDRASQQEFSQICQKILIELDDLEAADCYVDGAVGHEGAGVVAQVDSLLEAMFDCPFGEGESLKSIVVAVQSQVNNVDWTTDIVEFLRSAMSFLRVRYVVNDQTVDEIYDMMRERNLDPFRGSVSDRDIKTRYRLVEVDDH